MECLAEPMSADPSEHRGELLKRLDILRSNDSFCDVTIAVKSKEFKVHRAVLAASSPFFLTLLTSNMKESNEQLIKIELEVATESVMEDTLKYLYTGNVSVTEERAHNLIATANYLLLPSLKTMVGNFLKETVTTDNCLFNYYFAAKYECVELREKCQEVIKSNFSVVMETEDFLNLDKKQVLEWVSSDDVIVSAEEDIFKGIVKWLSYSKCDREGDFPELLHEVRMMSVSQDFLLNQLPKEELVTCNANLGLNFVVDSIKVKLMANDGQVQCPRKCLETHMNGIFVCGGRKALYYFPKKNSWYGMADTLLEHGSKCEFHPAQYKSKIYIFDKRTQTVDTSEVMECYADNNTWSAIQRAATSTDITKFTVVNDDLYALSFPLSKVEIYRYDAETDSWEVMESLPFKQEGSCVVNDEQLLYIISGQRTTRTSRYDSRDKKWEELAAVNEARWDYSGAAMDGKIYIAGGRDSKCAFLSSCEVYDPDTNEWQLMPSLKLPRDDGSMVCFEGQLYVLGGTSFNTQSGSHTRALTVEVFDSGKNEWTEISHIPVKNFESQEERKKEKIFQACVARLSKNVIGKLKLLQYN